jgi:predicted outer membrane lipoprotein
MTGIVKAMAMELAQDLVLGAGLAVIFGILPALAIVAVGKALKVGIDSL